MALELRDEFDLEDLERIRIATYGVAVRNAAGEPEKWDPKTRETADHSLPYVVAAALTDGVLTPASFDEGRIGDPALRPLMRMVEVNEDPRGHPQLSRTAAGADGNRVAFRTPADHGAADYPKGHSRNPPARRASWSGSSGASRRASCPGIASSLSWGVCGDSTSLKIWMACSKAARVD